MRAGLDHVRDAVDADGGVRQRVPDVAVDEAVDAAVDLQKRIIYIR